MDRWQGERIYIDFFCESKSGKSNIYSVFLNRYHLGDIKWYAPWQKYAFFSEHDNFYDRECLKDIARFLKKKNERIKE